MGGCRPRVQRQRLAEVIDGGVELPRFQIEIRHCIMTEGIGRIRLEQFRVRRQVFGVVLPLNVRVQRRIIARRARHHLDPEITHLVGRILAPHDTPRRMTGIADVVGGVVVDILHRDRRPLRQHDGSAVPVDLLPPEIPVGD